MIIVTDFHIHAYCKDTGRPIMYNHIYFFGGAIMLLYLSFYCSNNFTIPNLPVEYSADVCSTASSSAKNLDVNDRTLLAELDRVKKEMFKTPGSLLLSIRNIMNESRRKLTDKIA